MIRVLIFEDNLDFAEGIINILELTEGFECVGHFPNPIDAIKQIERLSPDVILMDIDMPLKTGVEALVEIKQNNIRAAVLMLTVFDDDDHIMHSIDGGADGYLLKESHPKKLLDSISDLMEGGAPMTPYVARRVLKLFKDRNLNTAEEDAYNLSTREKDILKTLCDGMSYKMIASQLEISYHTVNSHIKKIYDKLHVHSSVEAVTKAARERLV